MSNYDEQMAAILGQGINNNAPKGDQKFTKEVLLTKYFVPMVPQGKTDHTFKFRILPSNTENPSPFEEVDFHYMKTGPNQYAKLLCLKEDGHKNCTLCDTNEALKATAVTKEEKDEANKYRSSKYYIVKGIDRALENQGPKFWRFPRLKTNGILDIIKAKIGVYGNIIDPTKGYDLVITCGLNDKKKSIIKDISCVLPSELSDDPTKKAEWLADDTKWSDVWKAKEEKYLVDLVNGRAQYWDNNLKKFVTPGQENAVPAHSAESTPSTTETNATPIEANPLLKDEKINEESILGSSDDDDNDLPF